MGTFTIIVKGQTETLKLEYVLLSHLEDVEGGTFTNKLEPV